MFGKQSRIRESLALSAVFAGGVALHVAWIDHLLIRRSETIRSWVTINPEIGPISGLYLDVLGAFFVALLLALAFWKGRDVRHWQDRIFWFFLSSMVLFMLMTLPFVYGFAVV